MKLLKVIICLSIVSSLFLEITCINKNSVSFTNQHNKKKMRDDWWQTTYKNWNQEAVITVFDPVNNKATFNGQIDLIPAQGKVLEENPYGIGLVGLRQVETDDKTKFINSVLTPRQDLQNLMVLDFRLVQDCNFFDNEDAPAIQQSVSQQQKYFLQFEVYGKESYYVNQDQTVQNKDTFKVKIELPKVLPSYSSQVKQFIQGICQTRSTQMNTLKEKAKSTGRAYRQFYDQYQQRQLSLEQQQKLGVQSEQLIQQVQSQSQQRQVQINIQITTSQKTLQETITSLQQSTTLNLEVSANIDTLNKQLNIVKFQLQTLEQNSYTMMNQIQVISRELNEALQLQVSVQEKLKSNSQQQTTAAQNVKSEQQASALLLKQQQQSLAKIQAEYIQRQKEQEAKLKETAQQSAALNSKLASNQNDINQLKTILEKQQRQVLAISEQASFVKQQIIELQKKYDEKLSIAQKLIRQAEQQKQQQSQFEMTIKIQQTSTSSELTLLKQQEIANIQLLKANQTEIARLKGLAEQAFLDVQASYDGFLVALQNINNFAPPASLRTSLAIQQLKNGAFKSEIQYISSNAIQSIQLNRKRLAKLGKSNARLARAIRESYDQIRLQQVKKAHRHSKHQH